MLQILHQSEAHLLSYGLKNIYFWFHKHSQDFGKY